MAIKDPYKNAINTIIERHRPGTETPVEPNIVLDKYDPAESVFKKIKEDSGKELDALDINDPYFDKKLEDIQNRFNQKIKENKLITPPMKMNPGTKQLINEDDVALLDKPMMVAKGDPYSAALKDAIDRFEDSGIASIGEYQDIGDDGDWSAANKSAFDEMKKDFLLDQERRKKSFKTK